MRIGHTNQACCIVEINCPKEISKRPKELCDKLLCVAVNLERVDVISSNTSWNEKIYLLAPDFLRL